MDSNRLNYWRWLFKGSGGKPGYRRLINLWFLGHLVIGIIVSLLVPLNLTESAKTVLFPLAGVFIGLSFAFAGNVQSLMQSPEIEKLAQYHEGGFVEYVFVYQTTILVIMITLVLWGFAGLKVFEKNCLKIPIVYFLIKSILFASASLTLRECWYVVLGPQWMLLVKKEIKEKQ